MGGIRRERTPGWGVMDADGQWLDGAWHVEEAEARRVFAEHADAAVLCSDVDSDFIGGSEDQTIVEVKPLRCSAKGCHASVAQEFDGGCVVLDADAATGWDDVEPARCPKHAAEYVRVEYDRDYRGGDYSGVGEHVLVSRDRVDELERDGRGSPVERAFEEATGLSRERIVHYSEDEVFDVDGNAFA